MGFFYLTLRSFHESGTFQNNDQQLIKMDDDVFETGTPLEIFKFILWGPALTTTIIACLIAFYYYMDYNDRRHTVVKEEFQFNILCDNAAIRTKPFQVNTKEGYYTIKLLNMTNQRYYEANVQIVNAQHQIINKFTQTVNQERLYKKTFKTDKTQDIYIILNVRLPESGGHLSDSEKIVLEVEEAKSYVLYDHFWGVFILALLIALLVVIPTNFD